MSIPKKQLLLVVEDDERLREIIVHAAERTGAFGWVAAAADGQAACDFIWSRLRSHLAPPDYILSDLSMPRMDGIRLLRELRRYPETQGIPIAIMTSSNRPNDRQDAAAAGCCAFFNKPVRLDDIATLVASLPRICGADAIATAASDEAA